MSTKGESSQVLVVSVHPDDETLGCGGTLLKHSASGDALSWLIVTQAHKPQWSEEVIERKSVEIEKVAAAYGIVRTHRLGFPAAMLDTLPQSELIARIREVIAYVKPDIVYLVHDGDVHSDHHCAFIATMSVLKTFYMGALGVRRILCYETLSSTEAAPPQHCRAFIPNVFNDVTPYLMRKIEIMAKFDSERQGRLMPRGASAIQALARFRGASIGVEYAEAFMLLREVAVLTGSQDA